MLTGYRGIILALGLILAALPSGQSSYAQQAEAQQKAGDPLERIADALDEANEPKREAADCAEGGNDRKSDLCAQWKAADAAKQAAEAADWTVTLGWIGLVLGAVTMGAAIAAAKFARDAALHTEIAYREARNPNRAWLSYDLLTITPGTTSTTTVAVNWKNVGPTPATWSRVQLCVFNCPNDYEFEDRDDLPCFDEWDSHGPIGPGRDVATFTQTLTESQITHIINGTGMILVWSELEYRETYSPDVIRRSETCVRLSYVPPPGSPGDLPFSAENINEEPTGPWNVMT